MPKFSKTVLSQFLGTNCKRQLKFQLSKDLTAEIAETRMPPRQPQRPNFSNVSKAGEEWEIKKFDDLRQNFGAHRLRGNWETVRKADGTSFFKYKEFTLGSSDLLFTAIPGDFLVLPQFELAVDSLPDGMTYARESGLHEMKLLHNLEIADVIPDLVQVVAPGTYNRIVHPNGEIEMIEPDDQRTQLRIVDIKIASEPGPSYFTEVTFYSMALAGWLQDNSADGVTPLSNSFVVVPDAAIWPGSHTDSALTTFMRDNELLGQVPTYEEKVAHWERDLQVTVFDVYRFRIDHIIRHVLPEALEKHWSELNFHVARTCRNCDYLGYPWQKQEGAQETHPDHCWPTAEREGGHLCRVPGLSRGAVEVLQDAGYGSIDQLADLHHSDPVFDRHQSLRTRRTLISERATSLRDGQIGIADDTGVPASMPKFVNLKIYLTAAFDSSSALTVALGVSGTFYANATPLPETALRKRFEAKVILSEERSPDSEYEAFVEFLRSINAIIRDPEITRWQQENKGIHENGKEGPDRCRMQIYIWDTRTFQHFQQVISRNLDKLLAIDALKDVIWLFPSEELLPHPKQMSREGAITIVNEAVRTAVVAPIPYHYSLLNVARHYHLDNVENVEQLLNVHPLFEDALSDQIPSERAIEIWEHQDGYEDTAKVLVKTVKKHIIALRLIVSRLEHDLPLPDGYKTAPLIRSSAPKIDNDMSLDGQLWYLHARLNEEIRGREVHEIRSMPLHEREARGKSARLLYRLVGEELSAAVHKLDIQIVPGRRIYRLAETSLDVAIRDGQMGYALAPADEPDFLEKSYVGLAHEHGLFAMSPMEHGWRMEDGFAVTVVRIDRDEKLVVIDENQRRPHVLDDFEEAGAVDLSGDLVLDPVHRDYFTPLLHEVLKTVGRPVEAKNDPIVMRAIGQKAVEPNDEHSSTPLSRFLWLAGEECAQKVLPYSKDAWKDVKVRGLTLNKFQETALQESLGNRTHLIWGPPGTGKSHTLTALVTTALLDARESGRSLRILFTAATWTAIDSLMKSAYATAHRVMPGWVQFKRLSNRGLKPTLPEGFPDIVTEINRSEPSHEIQALRQALTFGNGRPNLIVVGATPNQVLNLVRANGGKDAQYKEEFFDIIIIDEGSQLDVAHATLALTALATDGRVICAGDPLQMAPIHAQKPPKGLEYMLGSIYDFLKHKHLIPETQLARNYRSNLEIVDAFRDAGYGQELQANSPAQRLRLKDVGRSKPKNWPDSLTWSNHLDTLLDPSKPVACAIHHDNVSAQANEFEAQLVVSLVWRLWTRIILGLEGEIGHDGQPIPARPEVEPDPASFWSKSIGIVTPHRAQQGMIVSGLIRQFKPHGHDAEKIRQAVDTVERFQGQERDIMIASYGVGDPDTIAGEVGFLHSLNRFNVMVSRARAKLLVIATHGMVSHLSSDLDVVKESRMLKHFVEAHCCTRHDLYIPWRKANGKEENKVVSFRYAERIIKPKMADDTFVPF